MSPIIEKNDIVPICPHDDAQLNLVYGSGLESTFGKRYIYFCPNCHKVLGLSHRKGFRIG